VPAKTRPQKPKWRLFGRRRRAEVGVADFGGFDPGAFSAPEPAGPRYETLGDELRAARQDKGLTLEELAETTRVRRAYLEAIEDMRLELLPSRPFTIGYIRAYAQALGLSGDAAVERFKAEEPVLDEPLPNPVGVVDERDPRVAAFIVGAIVIIAAIMTWNIAQHAVIAAAPPPTKASDDRAFKVLANARPTPIELGKPLPAPVESTVPPPYETPGLAEALGLKTEGATAPTAKTTDDPLAAAAALPSTFTPTGKVYDVANPQQRSAVTVQALKPGLLIARGTDGSVYFARQLGKGDAYRVPNLAGLTLDVSNPNDFQVFVAGQSKGMLPAPQVLASKLMTPAPAKP
jgi:cytoskeleton protein RodZ